MLRGAAQRGRGTMPSAGRISSSSACVPVVRDLHHTAAMVREASDVEVRGYEECRRFERRNELPIGDRMVRDDARLLPSFRTPAAKGLRSSHTRANRKEWQWTAGGTGRCLRRCPWVTSWVDRWPSRQALGLPRRMPGRSSGVPMNSMPAASRVCCNATRVCAFELGTPSVASMRFSVRTGMPVRSLNSWTDQRKPNRAMRIWFPVTIA